MSLSASTNGGVEHSYPPRSPIGNARSAVPSFHPAPRPLKINGNIGKIVERDWNENWNEIAKYRKTAPNREIQGRFMEVLERFMRPLRGPISPTFPRRPHDTKPAAFRSREIVFGLRFEPNPERGPSRD